MNDEIFDKIYLAIEKNGKHKKYRVSYAMENDLDDIALKGKVKIIFDEFYSSEILVNPSYLDLVVVANDMINVCDFHDHIYLENIIFVEKNDDVNIYTMSFGS